MRDTDTDRDGDSAGSGPVGPIIFGHPAARGHMLAESIVYTFRTRDRTTGDTWARSSRTGPKLVDVHVEQVAKLEPPSADALAEKWAAQSGFGTAEAWWAAIEAVHGTVEEGYVYRCTVQLPADDPGRDSPGGQADA